MPIILERSAALDVSFEPEKFLAKSSFGRRLFASAQRKDLQILYREALSAMPIQPGLDQNRMVKPS